MRAWYAKVTPSGHRLLAGRHYRTVAVDADVLTVTTKRGHIVFTAPIAGVEVTRLSNGLLLQVLVRDADRNTHVFEFRPRHHADGRALADTLRSGVTGLSQRRFEERQEVNRAW